MSRGDTAWSAAGRRLLRSRLYRGTPVVELHETDPEATISVKLELMLPSGSTKDRVAAHVLARGILDGELRRDDLVVEASSGSTSISLAMICASLGLRFRAVMPAGVSRERVLLIRRYGGEVELTPALRGLKGSLERVEQVAAQSGTYATRQFENPLNVEVHRRATGPELIAQASRPLDGFVAGVGTGGTLIGIGHALRDRRSRARIVRATPTTGAMCGGNPEISSAIPGVIDGFSRLYRPAEIALDGEVIIRDDEAVHTARRLCARGLPTGPSGGLNYAAALRLAAELGPGAHVGTVLCDRPERYFSAGLFEDVAIDEPAWPEDTTVLGRR